MYWPIRIGSILLAVAACFFIDSFAHANLSEYTQRLVVLAALYVTLAVSLNLINGITGQFSIGHAAFYQVGAYLTGYLSVRFFAPHGSPVGGPVGWLVMMMFVGAVIAAFAGFIVGLPSLRLRGDYLAIVTLGFGEILRIVVQNTDQLGGSYGMNVPKIQPIWLACLLAILCIAVCRNLLRTARGLTFVAVREDEIASSAMGVNITQVKVTAFMLGAAFAGAAGALLSHYEGFITPQTFSMDVSFIILTMVVLGGSGSITGSVFTAIFLFYLPEYLRTIKAPDGGSISFSGALIVGWLIAIALAVSLVRATINNGRLTQTQRVGYYVGILVATIIAPRLLTPLLMKVAALAQIQVESSQLRLVIFAVALISIMLIRPQGIFAHHEFSWHAVERLFGRKPKEPTLA